MFHRVSRPLAANQGEEANSCKFNTNTCTTPDRPLSSLSLSLSLSLLSSPCPAQSYKSRSLLNWNRKNHGSKKSTQV